MIPIIFLAPGAVVLSALLYGVGIVVYNLFFHPYSKHPGPFWAKITPLYSVWHAYIGDLHIDVLRCHEKYGPTIRYTPDRLVFNTLSGLRAIYGPGCNTRKAAGYAPHPFYPHVYNTHNCIDKDVHSRKRRIVRQAFADPSITSSEQYVLDHVRDFCNGLLAQVTDGKKNGWSEPVDMALWTNYFTLDVISDLTFGQSFDMLKNPKLRWLVESIVNGNRHIYLRFAWPRLFNMRPDCWYSPARWLFPTMLEDKKQFAAVAEEHSRARMQGGKSDRRDIMAALLEATDPRTGEKLSQEEVWGEAHLMIAAGGDTTSTALAAIFFFLSRTPDVYAKLAAEIRSKFDDVEQIRRGKAFGSCEYLKACIEEALRLAPAAPGSLWREVCEGGITVGRDFIPPGRDVGVCVYAIHHNEEYFPDSFAFRPERFLEKGTTNTNAFAPFSMGPRSCLAMPLAYLELQLAVARLIFMMDFEAVNNQGGGAPELGFGRQKPEEFQIWDMFSSNKTGPLLRFKAR